MNTLHCALENVNEPQKIRHYRVRSAEERRVPNRDFTSRGAYVKLLFLTITNSIENQT